MDGNNQWIIGVVIVILGNVGSNGGLNLQKLSLIREMTKPKEEQRVYPMQPLWLLGFIGVLSGALGDFVSLSFAPQSLLIPLSGVALIANIWFARICVGEKMSRNDAIGTLGILVGVVMIAATGSKEEQSFTLQELIALYSYPSFITYITIVAFIIAGLYSYHRYCTHLRKKYGPWSAEYVRVHRRHVFALPLLAGVFAGQTIWTAKSCAEMIKTTANGDNQFVYFGFYALATTMITLVLSQLHFLTLSLRFAPALIAVPVFQSSFIVLSIVGGGAYFQELASMTTVEISIFMVGLAILLAGMWLLSRRPLEGPRAPSKLACYVNIVRFVVRTRRSLRRNEAEGGWPNRLCLYSCGCDCHPPQLQRLQQQLAGGAASHPLHLHQQQLEDSWSSLHQQVADLSAKEPPPFPLHLRGRGLARPPSAPPVTRLAWLRQLLPGGGGHDRRALGSMDWGDEDTRMPAPPGTPAATRQQHSDAATTPASPPLGAASSPSVPPLLVRVVHADATSARGLPRGQSLTSTAAAAAAAAAASTARATGRAAATAAALAEALKGAPPACDRCLCRVPPRDLAGCGASPFADAVAGGGGGGWGRGPREDRGKSCSSSSGQHGDEAREATAADASAAASLRRAAPPLPRNDAATTSIEMPALTRHRHALSPAAAASGSITAGYGRSFDGSGSGVHSGGGGGGAAPSVSVPVKHVSGGRRGSVEGWAALPSVAAAAAAAEAEALTASVDEVVYVGPSSAKSSPTSREAPLVSGGRVSSRALLATRPPSSLLAASSSRVGVGGGGVGVGGSAATTQRGASVWPLVEAAAMAVAVPGSSDDGVVVGVGAEGAAFDQSPPSAAVYTSPSDAAEPTTEGSARRLGADSPRLEARHGHRSYVTGSEGAAMGEDEGEAEGGGGSAAAEEEQHGSRRAAGYIAAAHHTQQGARASLVALTLPQALQMGGGRMRVHSVSSATTTGPDEGGGDGSAPASRKPSAGPTDAEWAAADEVAASAGHHRRSGSGSSDRVTTPPRGASGRPSAAVVAGSASPESARGGAAGGPRKGSNSMSSGDGEGSSGTTGARVGGRIGLPPRQGALHAAAAVSSGWGLPGPAPPLVPPRRTGLGGGRLGAGSHPPVGALSSLPPPSAVRSSMRVANNPLHDVLAQQQQQ